MSLSRASKSGLAPALDCNLDETRHKRCARLLDAIASRSAAQCCSTSQCTHHSKAGLRAGPTDRSLAAALHSLHTSCTQLRKRRASRPQAPHAAAA